MVDVVNCYSFDRTLLDTNFENLKADAAVVAPVLPEITIADTKDKASLATLVGVFVRHLMGFLDPEHELFHSAAKKLVKSLKKMIYVPGLEWNR